MKPLICCVLLLCTILSPVTPVFSQDIPLPASSSESQENTSPSATASNKYHELHTSVTIFGGLLSRRNFSHLYDGPVNLVDTNMIGLSLTRELFSVGDLFNCRTIDPLKFEVEGMGIYHFGHWPEDQFFAETVGFMALRWHKFPWERHLLTTVGFGEGLSYASEEPSYEIEFNNKTANLLNYLMWDITLAHPDLPELAFVLRLHHRSGVFGLIEDVSGGSNFFTMGLKYTF